MMYKIDEDTLIYYVQDIKDDIKNLRKISDMLFKMNYDRLVDEINTSIENIEDNLSKIHSGEYE